MLICSAWPFFCCWYSVVTSLFNSSVLQTESKIFQDNSVPLCVKTFYEISYLENQCLGKIRAVLKAVVELIGTDLVSFVYRSVMRITDLLPCLVLGSEPPISMPTSREVRRVQIVKAATVASHLSGFSRMRGNP